MVLVEEVCMSFRKSAKKKQPNCFICGRRLPKMSVVPHGALAAKKVRQNEEMLKRGYERADCAADLSPTKYSSKFMNSIWGMYNRYSVHNLKKNMDESTKTFAGQPKESAGPSQSVEKNSTDFKGSLAVTTTTFLSSPGLL